MKFALCACLLAVLLGPATAAVAAAGSVEYTGEIPKKGLILTNAYQKMNPDLLRRSMEAIGLWSNPRQDWNVGWFYNYGLDPGVLLDWSARTGIEFVPMFNKSFVQFEDGSRCALAEGANNLKLCQRERLSSQLSTLKARYVELGGPAPSVLLGFNEPYSKIQANIEPHTAAGIYRDYLIPLAREHNLRLSSPSFVIPGTIENSNPSRAFVWFLDFLSACNADQDCDIEAIQILNIHNYDCRGGYWDVLGRDGAFFFRLTQGMVSRTNEGARGYWADYFSRRPIWVTETNCNHTGGEKLIASNAEQACRMALGKESADFASGSLAALDRSPVVERFAWFTTHNDAEVLLRRSFIPQERRSRMLSRHETADLVTDDGMALTPVGRAYRYFDSQRSDTGSLCYPTE